MIIEARTQRHAEVWLNLVFVLQVGAYIVGAVVAIGVALEKRGRDEPVGSVRGHQPLEELREVCKADYALVRSFIARVELGVGEAPAERHGVLAVSPNGVRRGHEAVLKNAGESPLTLRGAHANGHAGVGHDVYVVRSEVAEIVKNRETWEKCGAEHVQGRLRRR